MRLPNYFSPKSLFEQGSKACEASLIEISPCSYF